jgi:penicillin G amidase
MALNTGEARVGRMASSGSARVVRGRGERLVGSAVGVVLGLLARSRRPTYQGTVRLPGLHQAVEIRRDQWGVPHILAGDIHDLFFAQGFIHAQDRLGQMDFNRRLAFGRLAEVLGEAAVPIDRSMRVLGLGRCAERDAATLADDLRADLEAYAAGVNAGMVQQPLSLEFRLLRYRPDPWSAAHTLVWVRFMSWSLSVNWLDELVRARLIARLGEDKARELEPNRRDHCSETLNLCGLLGALGTIAVGDGAAGGRGPAVDRGSNAWVVHGSRTEAGLPLLANDMHLMLSIPSIWYENHLKGGDLHITGITFPGIPGVVAGHNGRVAWGFTNGNADVQDLYLEHLSRSNDGSVRCEFQGEWQKAEVRREEIRIRGGKTVDQEVIVTRHGPIVNDLAPLLAGTEPLALRWTSFDPDTSFTALERVWRARTCDEVRTGFEAWSGPVQNTVYADVEGNIGYSLVGLIPVRSRGYGHVPVPGWTGEYEWNGMIPYQEMPHLRNPDIGYIVTANNRQTFAECGHFLSDDYCSDNRAQRIAELIEAEAPMTLEAIRRQQKDQKSVLARLVGRRLCALAASATRDGTAVPSWASMFEDWDGNLAATSPQAGLYELFVDEFLRAELQPLLGDLYPVFLGLGPQSPVPSFSLSGEHALEWLAAILADPEARWWGGEREREDALRVIGDRAAANLRRRQGDNPAGWSWGGLHQLEFRHTLGAAGVLRQFLDRGPFPVGGDLTTVWMEFGGDEGPMIGPPFRFVADLSDLDHCQAVLVPGQSGRPGTPHYDDQIDDWLQGRYRAMLFDWQEVVRETSAVLGLRPS